MGCFAGIVEAYGMTTGQITDELLRFSESSISESQLAERVPEKQTEKFDGWLPEELLNEGYGKKFFDINRTKKWIRSMIV